MGIAAALTAGVVAFTPAPSTVARAAGPLEITAWGFYGATFGGTSLASHASTMSELNPFFFSARSATDIGYTSSVSKSRGDSLLQSYQSLATQFGKRIVPTVVDATGKLGMAAILADPAQRAAHVQALVTFAGGFAGVDLDYESFAFSDGQASWGQPGTGGTYDNWGAFLTELSAALHANGKTLEVSVPPIYNGSTVSTASPGYWVYNYPVMASTVDRVKVMMYSYNVAQPGPNSPLDWVKSTMTYIKSVIPPAKLLLGVPAYGTDWATKVDGTCPTDAIAKNVTGKASLTTANALQHAADKGVIPKRDAKSGEYTYSYVNSYTGADATAATVRCNVYRTVWYDDEQAIYDRVDLASTLGLAGIAVWALGYESAPTWDAFAAVQAGTPYTAPAPIAPSVKAPAVVAPYPPPITSAGPLPARYLDTRAGYKTADGLFAGGGAQPADSVLELPIASRGPVPSGTPAVVLNVTALGKGAGYVTVYPCGPRPTASSLNVAAGQTISNLVITELSATGTVCIYTQQPADLIVDVFSALPAGTVDTLDNPARLLDTRADQPTIDGQSAGGGALPVNGSVEVPVAGRGGVPANATSAVLNVTAVDAVGPGFLTVWPCDKPRPSTSNVNYAKSAAIPNAVVTSLSASGSVCVFSSNVTNVIVDVFASVAPAMFTPLEQAGRVLETRSGYATIDGQANAIGKSSVNQETAVQVAGRAGIPADATTAILNVTVDAPETAGYVTVYACGTARPPVSNVNFAKGQTLPVLVVTKLSATGSVCVFTNTTTHVILDAFGTLNLP
jgi:hypothetical protein